ncbi:uncharacterized protein LOC108340185 [Vigna angularis]|uniref:uncharacterized protein LOC108340185 n=1 Tax=Phaseolus angularis TaxID=3914 RepID=UPI000809E4CF|nr:uncharacterized protein LOC108340185 [Vigna angularis]
MAARQTSDDRRFGIKYFRRRYHHRQLTPLTPPQTPEIISHKPKMIDDDSEEDIEREEKVHLQEKKVDEQKKKVHENIKPKEETNSPSTSGNGLHWDERLKGKHV